MKSQHKWESALGLLHLLATASIFSKLPSSSFFPPKGRSLFRNAVTNAERVRAEYTYYITFSKKKNLINFFDDVCLFRKKKFFKDLF